MKEMNLRNNFKIEWYTYFIIHWKWLNIEYFAAYFFCFIFNLSQLKMYLRYFKIEDIVWSLILWFFLHHFFLKKNLFKFIFLVCLYIRGRDWSADIRILKSWECQSMEKSVVVFFRLQTIFHYSITYFDFFTNWIFFLKKTFCIVCFINKKKVHCVLLYSITTTNI